MTELRNRFRPVHQSRFGWPNGNCLEACIASITGIPLSHIPDGRPDGPWVGWKALRDWLGTQGWLLVWIPFVLDEEDGWPKVGPEMPYILSGTAASGLAHAVVAAGGQVIHNPNPNPGTHLVSVSGVELLVSAEPITDLPAAEGPSCEEMERARQGGGDT